VFIGNREKEFFFPHFSVWMFAHCVSNANSEQSERKTSHEVAKQSADSVIAGVGLIVNADLIRGARTHKSKQSNENQIGKVIDKGYHTIAY